MVTELGRYIIYVVSTSHMPLVLKRTILELQKLFFNVPKCKSSISSSLFVSKLKFVPSSLTDSFSFIYKLGAKLQGLPASNRELEMKVSRCISLEIIVTVGRLLLFLPKIWPGFCKLRCNPESSLLFSSPSLND